MIKPILVESKEYSAIQLGMTSGLHLEDGTAFALRKYQHIILVDTEADIVEGAFVYHEKGVPDKMYVIGCKPIEGLARYKILASTLKPHHLPNLSPQSIQLLINYYNEHKCMPASVEVEEKMGDDAIVAIGLGDSLIKPNQQGEVDITIPEIKETSAYKNSGGKNHLTWIFDRLVNVHGENPNYDYMLKLKEIAETKVYTEAEVSNILVEYKNDTMYNGGMTDSDVQEWFDKNKK